MCRCIILAVEAKFWKLNYLQLFQTNGALFFQPTFEPLCSYQLVSHREISSKHDKHSAAAFTRSSNWLKKCVFREVNYTPPFPNNHCGVVLEWDIEPPAAAAAAAVQGSVCVCVNVTQCAAESRCESTRLTRSFPAK